MAGSAGGRVGETEESLPVGGFVPGMVVDVRGGLYDGDHGVVVDRRPDLRPGTVWVGLTTAGVRPVPARRLCLRG